MKKHCKKESVLSAFADGELSDRKTRNIRLHLETCPECRNKMKDIQKTDNLLRNLADIEPSAEFDNEFWKKVGAFEEELDKRQKRRFGFIGRRPFLAAGLATGLAFGLVAGFFQLFYKDQRINQHEIFMAENIELLRDYEMIHHLDLLEDWDVIEGLKDNT